MVLLGFAALEIKATGCVNTFRECIIRRRTRIIVRNAQGNFVLPCFGKWLPFNVTFWNKDKNVASLHLLFIQFLLKKRRQVREVGKTFSSLSSGI